MTRTDKHARDPRLEEEIRYLNAALEPAEVAATERFEAPQRPIVFIVGGARSGSTLALQTLVATGLFGYASNFMSRFPAAPFLLARIQRLYTDMDVLGEFPEFAGSMDFRSLLGKTRGMLAPHEFWYFWRRYFRFPDPMCEEDAAVQLTNQDLLLRELAAMESVFQRSLLFKGHIFSWNLPFIAGLLPNSLFLHVTRDPVTQGASLLRARREFFDDETQWYSWRTPDYSWLATLPPIQQVVGQAMSVDASVARGAATIRGECYLVAPYEALCENPGAWLSRVGNWLKAVGIPIPENFQDTQVAIRPKVQALPEKRRVALEQARDQFGTHYSLCRVLGQDTSI